MESIGEARELQDYRLVVKYVLQDRPSIRVVVQAQG